MQELKTIRIEKTEANYEEFNHIHNMLVPDKVKILKRTIFKAVAVIAADILFQKLIFNLPMDEIINWAVPTAAFIGYTWFHFTDGCLIDIDYLMRQRIMLEERNFKEFYNKILIKKISKLLGVPKEEAKTKFDNHIELLKFHDEKRRILKQLKTTNKETYKDISVNSQLWDIYVDGVLITIENIDEVLQKDEYEIIPHSTKSGLLEQEEILKANLNDPAVTISEYIQKLRELSELFKRRRETELDLNNGINAQISETQQMQSMFENEANPNAVVLYKRIGKGN